MTGAGFSPEITPGHRLLPLRGRVGICLPSAAGSGRVLAPSRLPRERASSHKRFFSSSPGGGGGGRPSLSDADLARQSPAGSARRWRRGARLPPRPLEAALAFRASSRRSERCAGITDPYPELAAGSVSALQIGWGVLCHFPREEEGKKEAGAKEGVSSPGRWVHPPGCPLARLSCRQCLALRAGEKCPPSRCRAGSRPRRLPPQWGSSGDFPPRSPASLSQGQPVCVPHCQGHRSGGGYGEPQLPSLC